MSPAASHDASTNEAKSLVRSSVVVS